MILAFDVTQPRLHISWQLTNGNRGFREITDGKAAEVLLPTINEIVTDTGEALSAIAVVRGPGSFTGIRVGLSTAMGLRAASGVPVYAFDKLLLACPLLVGKTGVFVLPSGRREVLVAVVRDGEILDNPQIIPHKDLSPGEPCYSVGLVDGVPTLSLAGGYTGLCLDQIAEGAEPVEIIEPYYVRPPDAKRSPTLLQKLLDGTREG